MSFDNSDFLSIIHDLVGNSKECIEELRKFNEKTEDEELKALIVSAASLLTIHNTLTVQMAEQNANILDQATKLLETLNERESNDTDQENS